MLDPILINPDNRLLGYSTHDFSLYGGQTSPEMRVARADPAPLAPQPGSGGQGAALSESRATPDLAPAPDLSAATDVPPPVPEIAAPPSPAAPLAPDLAWAGVNLAAPLVPAAAGSGGYVPANFGADAAHTQPAAAPTQDNAPLQPSGAPAPATEAMGFITTTAVPLVENFVGSATAAVAGTVALVEPVAESLLQEAAPPIEAATELVADTAALAAPVLDTVGEAAAAVTAPVSDDLVDSAASIVTPTVDATADAAAAAAAPVVEAVTDIAAAAASPIAPAVEAVAPAVEAVASTAQQIASAPLEAATSGPLADAAAPEVEDAREGIAGTDPAAGVATLISLVSISDVFDVGESAPASDSAPILLPPLLDTLAGEVPSDEALLGGGPHDGGGLDSPLTESLGF